MAVKSGQQQRHAIARRGLMLVLSSPSGAGKTTLSRKLLEVDPEVELSVSVTTRKQRPGEIDGRGQPVKPTKRRPVRPRTVARSLKLLRQACRFGANYRTTTGAFLLESDPTRGLPVPVESNPRRPVADSARFERLLAVADRVMMLDARGELTRSYLPELLVLAEGTGRRIGAILALRSSDWTPTVGTHGTMRWRAEHDKVGQERLGTRQRKLSIVLDRLFRRVERLFGPAQLAQSHTEVVERHGKVGQERLGTLQRELSIVLDRLFRRVERLFAPAQLAQRHTDVGERTGEVGQERLGTLGRHGAIDFDGLLARHQ